MTIRVVLADDQTLIRAGFRALIDSADGREAVRLVRDSRADVVVVMDIRMPELDGREATRQICADDDLAGVRILILTTFELDEYVVEALRAGASSFLGNGVEPAELLDAIRLVAAGEALVARFLAQPADGPTSSPESLASLTDREREVVALVAQGLSNDDIAQRLFVSPLTAKTHVNRAVSKLNVRDRAQLVVIAYQSGLIGG